MVALSAWLFGVVGCFVGVVALGAFFVGLCLLGFACLAVCGFVFLFDGFACFGVWF